MLRPTWALATALVAVALVLPSITAAAPVQCYCVLALRTLHQIPIYGHAWLQKPNTEQRFARAGDVVIFNYGGVGKDHVALITSFTEPTEGNIFINILEYNYKECQMSRRTLSLFDPTIRGVFRPPLTSLSQ